MSAIIGDRLKERREAAGLSQADLAERVKLTQPSIGRLESGDTRETGKLYALARELKTTPEYLTGESDDPSPVDVGDRSSGYRAEPSSLIVPQGGPIDASKLVGVREIDLTFGMGATYMEVPVTTTIRYFSRDWVRQYTRADPDMLFFAQGIGDCMEPTIVDSDLLLVDASQKTVHLHNKIWAIAYGQAGGIKRLRPMADGSIKMLCDNPSIPDEVAYDGELAVLGRVVAAVRKL